MVEQLPDTAQAHYRLGRAYKQTQQMEPAIEAFRAAIMLDSQLHWAYMGLLNILMQRSLWDEAIALCQSVIEGAERQARDIAWAYCFMGNAQAKKGDTSLATQAHQQAFFAERVAAGSAAKLSVWAELVWREYSSVGAVSCTAE